MNHESETIRVIPCEVFTRVVGYFQPIQRFNDGKREEYHDRITFSEKKSLTSPLNKLKLSDNFEIEPDIIVSNGKQDIIYVGVKLCSECDNIKKKIENKEIEAIYLGFNKPNDAIDYIKKHSNNIGSEILLPVKIEKENKNNEFFQKS
jgi:hypothetical protein